MGISKYWKKYVWHPAKKVWNNTVGAVVDWIVDAITPDIPDMPSADSNETRGTTVNRRGGNYTIPVVYASASQFLSLFNFLSTWVKIGGIESHISSSGTDNKYLHLTYVLHEGLGTGLKIEADTGKDDGTNQTLIRYGRHIGGEDDGQYNLDTSHNVLDATDDNGRFVYNAWKVASITANNNFVPSWHNDKATYPGLSVVKIRLRYPDADHGKNQTFIRRKPNFKFYVKGIESADYSAVETPLGLTSSADNSLVSLLYEYLISTKHGAGIDPADIDSTSFANVISFLNNDGVFELFKVSKFYRINTTGSIISNIKSMLWQVGCALIYEDGKFILRIDPNYVTHDVKGGLFSLTSSASSLPTIENDLDIVRHTVAESDVVGGIQLLSTPNNEIPYQYEYSYIQEENETVVYPENPPTWRRNFNSNNGLNKVAVDDTHIKKMSINGNMPAIEYRFYEAQFNNTVSLTLSPKHANVRVYDIIEVTYPKANLSNDKFVVIEVTRNIDMSIGLKCKQHIDEINLGNKWNNTSFSLRLAAMGVPFTKQKLVVPVGYGLDNNTQIDEFVPSYSLPTITNLTVVSTLDLNIIKNGIWYNGLQINFDELVDSLVSGFRVYAQAPNSEEWVFLGNQTSNSFKVQTTKLITGITYDIKVVPVDVTGHEGSGTIVSVTVPYREGENAIRGILSSSSYPTGIVVDAVGNTQLNEDGGLMWCQLQSPPGSGHPNCTLGSDAQHDLHDAWADWEPGGLADNGNGGAWYSTHPLTGCTSSTIDGYYYPPSVVEANRVYLNADEEFVAVGKATVSVVGFTDNDTANGSYALYGIGWKIYDSSDTLIYTFTASSPTSNAGNYHSPAVVGNITGQSYAVPYFHIYGAGTSGCDQVAIHDYDFEIIRNASAQISYKDLDTSVLTGAVGAREIDIVPAMKNPKFKDGAGNTFSVNRLKAVRGVWINSAETETLNVTGSYIGLDAVSYNPEIKVVDIATNNVTDAVIDLTVYGLPNVIQVKNDKGIFTDFVLVENQIR